MDPHLSAIFDDAAGHYRDYSEHPVHVAVAAYLERRILERLPAGSTILDAGSGPGALALPLARRGFRVLAVDVSPRMIARLREAAAAEGLPIEAICADVRALPKETRADAMISIDGPIGYAGDPLPLFERMVAPLSPGAPVWLALPRAASISDLARSPLGALAPLVAGNIDRAGILSGRRITVRVWDPRALASRLEPRLRFDRLQAIGLLVRLGPLDRALGRLPLLSRLGASSVLEGRLEPG